MKNDQYFKHDASASGNKKLMVLLQEEGMRGYGAYWLLIETLRNQPSMRAPLTLLGALSYRLRTKTSFLLHIVEDYGLFSVADGYFSSAGLCRRMKAFIRRREALDSLERTAQESRKSLKINPSVGDNAGTEEKRRENNSNNTDGDNGTKLPPTAAPATVVAAPQKPAAAAQKTTAAPQKPVAAAPRRAAAAALEPVAPWSKLIDQMVKDRSWMEMVGMHSGFKQLYIDHHGEIVRLFREHIRLYDKGGGLLRVQDVKQYFVNFLSPGGITHTKVGEHLRQLVLRQHQEAGGSPFETVVDGKRTYLGYAIPNGAPPRPDAQAVWDEETQSRRH